MNINVFYCPPNLDCPEEIRYAIFSGIETAIRKKFGGYTTSEAILVSKIIAHAFGAIGVRKLPKALLEELENFSRQEAEGIGFAKQSDYFKRLHELADFYSDRILGLEKPNWLS